MKREPTKRKIRVFTQQGIVLYCDCSDLQSKAPYELCATPERIIRMINTNIL